MRNRREKKLWMAERATNVASAFPSFFLLLLCMTPKKATPFHYRGCGESSLSRQTIRRVRFVCLNKGFEISRQKVRFAQGLKMTRALFFSPPFSGTADYEATFIEFDALSLSRKQIETNFCRERRMTHHFGKLEINCHLTSIFGCCSRNKCVAFVTPSAFRLLN